MRSNYDFDYLSAVRGKYFRRHMTGSNIVLLEPDVAKIFRTSKAVNEALRSLLKVAAETRRVTAPAGERSPRKRKSSVGGRR